MAKKRRKLSRKARAAAIKNLRKARAARGRKATRKPARVRKVRRRVRRKSSRRLGSTISAAQVLRAGRSHGLVLLLPQRKAR